MMMNPNSIEDLLTHLDGAVQVDGDQVTVANEFMLPGRVDALAYSAVFSVGLTRDFARWLIWEIAQSVGIYPSSIHQLYMAIGRGDVPTTFTVPAMNIRGANYDTSCALFRAVNKLDVGAFIFEIARSEMAYTDQRPTEYVTCVLAAALKEGYRGPVYIQGDHFQISAKNYRANPDKEVNAVKELMQEAVEAGFYNIDIDTSTLVDLSFPTLDEQQQTNYSLCAELTRYARSLEPAGITISLGGEIGEVGHKNSTVEELHAFMQGYNRHLGKTAGISKISVQTGTSHGGVVLPDGTLADVKVDFATLGQLGQVARESYSLGGAVQHGASTLPADAFNKFPEVGTVEIHLATGFQNILFDNAPEEMIDMAYNYVLSNLRDEWKTGQTEEQFIYSSRKKALGALKKQWWELDRDAKEKIGDALQKQFEFLFDKLNVKGSHATAGRFTTIVKQHRPRPDQAIVETALEIASDLAD